LTEKHSTGHQQVLVSHLSVDKRNSQKFLNGNERIEMAFLMNKGKKAHSTPTAKSANSNANGSANDKSNGSAKPSITKKSKQQCTSTIIDKPKSKEVALDGSLMAKLSELKKAICEEERRTDPRVMPHHIFTIPALESVCKLLPKTLGDLSSVEGFPRIKIDKYGQRIINIVREHLGLGDEAVGSQRKRKLEGIEGSEKRRKSEPTSDYFEKFKFSAT
jgi:superfamily II DNA helicase RecQ